MCVSVLMVGCNQGQTRKETQIISKEPTQAVRNEHNAEISLDWSGTYEGILPCGDCEGIKTRLTLNDNHTYVLTEQYLKNSQVIPGETYQGTFTFDKQNASLIKLGGKTDRVFFVGENFVEARNKETGKVISNNLPYKLTKSFKPD